MTKTDYLTQLGGALKRHGVADTEDIVSEYEQHFAFKLADGFPEEEIAAKLGAPESIAVQFETETTGGGKNTGGKALICAALSFAGIFEGGFFILLFGWIAAVTAGAFASAAAGAGFLGHFNVRGLLPPMPYASALIFGVCLLAFAVLLAGIACYFSVYTRQLIRASVRWHKNAFGGALPPLPRSPQLEAVKRRKLRSVLLWSATVFGVTFVLGMLVSMLLSGSLGFWHTWHWFIA